MRWNKGRRRRPGKNWDASLLLFIAYNLFHAFLDRNLKPQARAGRSEKYWADLIAAEFVVLFHRSPKPA